MKYSDDWFTHNIPVWEQHLKPLKGKPIHAIELGSYEGRSSVWLLDNILTHHEATITCVDTWEGGVEHKDKDMKAVEKRFMNNVKDYGTKVAIFEGTTTDFLLANQDQRADLVYIDAGHQAADCLTDGVLSHLLLKPGGIIIFDDYLWAGTQSAPSVPKPAIDAFLTCFANQYQLLHIGYQVVVRKK